MESLLHHNIQRSLAYHLYHNAIFLAERLFAHQPTFLNMFTLANSHYMAQQIHTAYHFLKHHSTTWKVYSNSTSPSNNLTPQDLQALDQVYYLYCMCCMKLEKLSEAETLIISFLSKRTFDANTHLQDYDIQSNLYYWLGIICRYSDRKQMAISYFQKALDANPFLWSAFDNLSQLGVVIDPANVFDKSKSTQLLMKYRNSAQIIVKSHKKADSNKRLSLGTLLQSPNSTTMNDSLIDGNQLKFTGTPSSGIMTPLRETLTTPASNLSYMSPSRFDEFSLKSPSHKGRRESGSSVASVSATPLYNATKTPNSNNMVYSTPSPIPNTNITDFTTPLGPHRKIKPKKKPEPNTKVIAGKLFESQRSNIVNNTGSTSSASTSRANSLYSPPTFPQQAQQASKTDSTILQSQQSSLSNLDSSDVTEKDIHHLLTLLEVLGRPIQLFCQYRCQEALSYFSKLPPKQFQTGWVYNYVGRSYFEMAQYEHGEKAFEQVLRLEPYRLDGLEVYSTILWHLKNKKQSSYLAHHMGEIDKLAPQTLCAIGNCFSLQKDHETALKFFERATKVNRYFTYAYTLAGHEWFANDDLDEALASYRKAIRIDGRHYNAWYGIGSVYFRQEKYEQAEYHFRKAMEINDKSSILFCYAGMALTARKKYKEAMEMLDRALLLHPQNYVAKYKRANVLVALRREQEALEELTALVQFVPKEASVYFTIGKIYARVGKKDLALLNFNTALDLERTGQKENPFIKEQIAKLFEENQMDEDEEEAEEGFDEEYE